MLKYRLTSTNNNTGAGLGSSRTAGRRTHRAQEGSRSVHSDEPTAADENEGLAGLGFPAQEVPASPRTARQMWPDVGPSGRPVPRQRDLRSKMSRQDMVFRGVLRGSGAWVLILMILVGSFLAYRGVQALRVAGWSFLTTQEWNPAGPHSFGIAAVAVGTVLIALVAVLTAVPLAIGAALYINEYAPGPSSGS